MDAEFTNIAPTRVVTPVLCGRMLKHFRLEGLLGEGG